MGDVAHIGKNGGEKYDALLFQSKLHQDNVTGPLVEIAKKMSRGENIMLDFEKVVLMRRKQLG